MKRIHYLLALTTVSAIAIGSAYATQHEENDALAVAGVKIDLAQAVNAAEQRIGGKASRAEFEQRKGQGVFEVEVVKGRQVMDVRVDAGTGMVLAAKEDKADHEHEDGRDD